MPPDGLDREDVEHALEALASESPAPTADAASLIARGKRRIVRQRLVVVGVALAVVATAAGVGAVANREHTRRVAAPVPTTAPSGVGGSREIAVASSLEAWKCLNPLQYTDNGGRSWRVITLPKSVPAHLLNCTAVAGGNAWVTSSSDGIKWEIVRIRDAGKAVALPFPRIPYNAQLLQPVFIDKNHGWVQRYEDAKPNALYRTSDGGETWTLTANKAFGGLAFADANHGWSTYGDTVSTTSDGGASWRAVDLPKPVTDQRIHSFQVEAHDDWVVVWRGVHVGGSRYRPFIDFSTDGGRTWLMRAGPDEFELPGAEQNAFDAIGGRSWALTSGAALRIATNAGPWQTRPNVPGARYFMRIYFPTVDIGWANTSSGRILRTTNSGYTWTDVTDGAATTTTTPAQPAVQAQVLPIPIAFVSAKEGWLCSNPLRYTNDGGKSWRSVGYSTSPPVPPSYQQPLCAAVPGGDAWVLTATADPRAPQIIHFRRGGAAQDDPLAFPRLPTATRVVELTFADRDHGWAISEPTEGGVPLILYRTTDGGRTWSTITHYSPLGLHFTSATEGWGAGARHTTDGGQTWGTADAPTPDHPPGVFAALGDTVVTPNAIVVRGATSGGSIASLFFDVTDDGRTWTMHTGQPPHEIVGTTEAQAFGVLDIDHWQFAASNALYVTADRGDNWTQVADFAGVQSISSIAFLTPEVGFVSALGRDGAAVVLGTTDGGDDWTTVDEQAPAGPRGDVASFPGGIIGCPTRTIVPEGPTVAIARAAIAHANFRYASASSVYRANSGEGAFAEIFRFNVGSCGADVLENTWVAYIEGESNAGPAGSTTKIALALAHYADGWHVFGRYP